MTCLNALEVKSWKSWKSEKSNQNIAMDEESVQNSVADEEFVESSVMDAKIDPKVVMDLSMFKIGGCNNLQRCNQNSIGTAEQSNIFWNNSLMRRCRGC